MLKAKIVVREESSPHYTGKTSAEIAADLVLSRRTVGGHISNILNKTSTSNRAEAVVYASRSGLI